MPERISRIRTNKCFNSINWTVKEIARKNKDKIRKEWNIEGIIWESKIYAVINSGSIITRY